MKMIFSMKLTYSIYHIMQIVHGGILSWLQCPLKFVGKLLWLCSFCNTLLTSFVYILLENFHGN